MLPFAYERDKLLSEVSTLGIGGPARFFAVAKSIDEMGEMLHHCRQTGLSFFILGKGSNSLFDDRGFDGLVIANRIDTLKREENRFIVGAGYSFARLGMIASKEGWSGLECAVGIPASVGGAIYMNAGANGQETKSALEKVSYIDEQGALCTAKKEELRFSYRFSSFQERRCAIVEGVFALTYDERAKLKQKEILDYRLATQPYGEKSAGCAFRNPDCHFAGKLIEESGWKGKGIGGAVVSEKHANFILNAQGATSSDFRAVIEKIKEEVLHRTGVMLEEEIRYVPYKI